MEVRTQPQARSSGCPSDIIVLGSRQRWKKARPRGGSPSRTEGNGHLPSSSRILVAVSTPWAGEKLFATVRDLSDRLHGSVVVAHVARPTEQDDSSEDTDLRSRQTLSALTTRLKEADIPAEGLLLYGDNVARAILNAADDQSATLVVLGMSGKGRLARLLGGDIPRRVIRHAQVPVLLYPPDWSGTI